VCNGPIEHLTNINQDVGDKPGILRAVLYFGAESPIVAFFQDIYMKPLSSTAGTMVLVVIVRWPRFIPGSKGNRGKDVIEINRESWK